MKPVRLFCYMSYGPDGTQRSTNILIFLTNETSHWIILSQFANRKQSIVHLQGAYNINRSTVVFIMMFVVFREQSPLITMSLPTKRESHNVVNYYIYPLFQLQAKFTYAGFASELKKVVTTVKPWNGAVSFPFCFEVLFSYVLWIGPMQLAIHVVQSPHAGGQKLHWDKANKRHT